MNVLSLFAGIGGLELGLERAGMTVVGQVEIDDYCRRVLAKHWPNVPRHDDVRTTAEWWLNSTCHWCEGTGYANPTVGDCFCLREARRGAPGRRKGVEWRPRVDVICGGFPCQPFSHAGKQLGMADDRWGWPWFADVVRRVGCRYVVVENVAALVRDRDAFGWMLGDLHELGFDAEWQVLRAVDTVGAPHIRPRLFLVAHPHGAGLEGHRPSGQRSGERSAWQGVQEQDWAEPDTRIRGVAHGVPARVDRLRALGNAVVPQVAEHIGRLIVKHAQAVAA